MSGRVYRLVNLRHAFRTVGVAVLLALAVGVWLASGSFAGAPMGMPLAPGTGTPTVTATSTITNTPTPTVTQTPPGGTASITGLQYDQVDFYAPVSPSPTPALVQPNSDWGQF